MVLKKIMCILILENPPRSKQHIVLGVYKTELSQEWLFFQAN